MSSRRLKPTYVAVLGSTTAQDAATMYKHLLESLVEWDIKPPYKLVFFTAGNQHDADAEPSGVSRMVKEMCVKHGWCVKNYGIADTASSGETLKRFLQAADMPVYVLFFTRNGDVADLVKEAGDLLQAKGKKTKSFDLKF